MPLTGPPRAAAGSASDPASVASRLPRPTGPSPKRSGPSVVTPTSRRPCPPGEADSSRHPVGPGSSKSPRSGSFRTFPIAKDWHGLAQPLWTLRVVLPGHGGDRFHPAVLAALPRRERTLGPRDRDRLDPRSAIGPGPVSGRTLVRPDRLAQALSDRRAGGDGPLDRAPAKRARCGLARVPGRTLRRERHLPRGGRESLRGRGGGLGSPWGRRRGPGRPSILEADRHRAGGPGG